MVCKSDPAWTQVDRVPGSENTVVYYIIYDKVKPKLRTYVHVRVLYAYIGSKYEYFRTMTYMDNCHVPCFLIEIHIVR